jgi:hypothetical protein
VCAWMHAGFSVAHRSATRPMWVGVCGLGWYCAVQHPPVYTVGKRATFHNIKASTEVRATRGFHRVCRWSVIEPRR